MACFCFAISLHSRRPRLLDACMTTQQAVNQQSHEYWSQSCCRNNFGPSWTCHSQLIVQHFPVQYRGIALDSAFDKTKQLHVASLIRERERERECIHTVPVQGFCDCFAFFSTLLCDETLDTGRIDMRCPHIPSSECCKCCFWQVIEECTTGPQKILQEWYPERSSTSGHSGSGGSNFINVRLDFPFNFPL